MKTRTDKKTFIILFLILGIVNTWIFWKRDQFQFIDFVVSEDLYGNDSQIFTHPHIIYNETEIGWARTISREFIRDSMTTTKKLEAIAFFLLSKFHDQRGIPSAQMMQLKPMDTFTALCSSKSNKVWCGQFGHLMLLLATANQIKGRYIEIFNPGNHHVLNEFYIPEWKQWVMTDMYNDVIFARNTKGKYVNVQEFRNLVVRRDSINIYRYNNGILSDTLLNKSLPFVREYHSRPNPYYYYKTTNLEEVYSPYNKLKRYFFAAPWYHIYQDNPGTNTKHYIKLALLASWLLLIMFWFAFRTKLSND